MTTARSRKEQARKKILAMYRHTRPLFWGQKRKKLNVLVADDDPVFRAVVKSRLGAGEGIGSVWEAGDGEEAIRSARALRPDVILLDLTLPRIDGLEATRLIKAVQPEISVVVCSVHDAPIYRAVAMMNGAEAFVPKSSLPRGIDLIDRVVREKAS